MLGHSLGGMLGPRIGLADKSRIAGFVIFAGATRPIEDELVRQSEYLFGLDGQITAQERAQIDELKRQATLVKQLKPADATRNNQLVLFVPRSYWLDLRGYSPPAVALQLKQPLLVHQGERDYNVTMDAFRERPQALGQRADVSFKSYPKLDHFFYEGTGPAKDTDHASPHNIPKFVVDDIAVWIKKQR